MPSAAVRDVAPLRIRQKPMSASIHRDLDSGPFAPTAERRPKVSYLVLS